MADTTSAPAAPQEEKPAPVPAQRSDSAQAAHRRFMVRSKW